VAEDQPKLKHGLFGYTGRSVERLLRERGSTFRLQLDTQARLAQQKTAGLESQIDAAKDEARALTETLRERDRELERAKRDLAEERDQLRVLRTSVAELRERIREASEVVEQGNDAISTVATLESELAAVKDELRIKALETWTLEQERTTLREELASMRGQLREQQEADEEARRSAQEEAVAKLVSQELSTAIDQAVGDVVKQVRERAEEQLALAERLRLEAEEELARVSAWRRSTGPLIGSVREGMDRTRERIDELPELVAGALAPLTESLDSLGEPIGDLHDAIAIEPGEKETIELPDVDDAVAADGEDPDPGDDAAAPPAAWNHRAE
jgi:chromosome segregation ATPase